MCCCSSVVSMPPSSLLAGHRDPPEQRGESSAHRALLMTLNLDSPLFFMKSDKQTPPTPDAGPCANGSPRPTPHAGSRIFPDTTDNDKLRKK
ncbi:unnamed protein product [Linum trigynum]|uniref:Uncharacterized protein n=1 Tax=Linum trigynum TaxID=586398 RepID=A0AAV2CI89_9ROSI